MGVCLSVGGVFLGLDGFAKAITNTHPAIFKGNMKLYLRRVFSC